MIKYLKFDSDILGVKCGRINHPNDINIAHQKKYRFLTAKIDSQKIDLVNNFIEYGGTLIDTEIVFAKPKYLNLNKFRVSDIKIKRTRGIDQHTAIKFAKLFTHSRFFKDIQIQKSQAGTLWENSIINHFREQKNYICFNDGEEVGFIIEKTHKSISEIFLIGVLQNYQGRGVGKEMISVYENGLGEGIKTLTVETQISNYSAQRLYIECGYRPLSYRHIIHVWL